MKKFRLTAIVVGALVVLGLASCTVNVGGYPRVAPSISASRNLVGQINIGWYPVDGAVDYNIYDTTDPFNKFPLYGIIQYSGSSYLYVDFPLLSGTYWYQVESVFADGGYSPLSTEEYGIAY